MAATVANGIAAALTIFFNKFDRRWTFLPVLLDGQSPKDAMICFSAANTWQVDKRMWSPFSVFSKFPTCDQSNGYYKTVFNRMQIHNDYAEVNKSPKHTSTCSVTECSSNWLSLFGTCANDACQKLKAKSCRAVAFCLLWTSTRWYRIRRYPKRP